MGIHTALNHKTIYRYDKHVSLGPQIVRLKPAPHSRIPVLSYSLKISPENHFINWQQDPQGNFLARLVFPEKTNLFQIEVDMIVDMTVINPFDFFLEDSAENWPFHYEPWLNKELLPFLEFSEDNFMTDFLKSVPVETQRTIDFLVYLTGRVQKEIAYLVRMEPGVQTPAETLTKKSGSCRDSAWLLVQMLRKLGLAARFVSGYLIQLKPDVKSLTGPSGTEVDFTDLHAWTEVYLPGAGWIGLDPTSGLLTGESHIPLVATPYPSSAAPISGMVEACETKFEHYMDVTRILENPRVTKPYSDRQWDEIKNIGSRVDTYLQSADVRLTSGGEPTFIAIDDLEGEEWNTKALGKMKLDLSHKLLKRLKARWAPDGSFLFSGQGKWYPGEQLPRWVLGCFWRKDGKPVWKDESLLASEEKNYGFGINDAENFIKTLSKNLGLNSEFIIPAYEDIAYYLLRERKLPSNVDPVDSRLKDPMERERLIKIFEKGLGETVGYVLPARKKALGKTGHWVSSAWYLRTEHLFLVPGDSPLGLRLPLQSIPWVKPEDKLIFYDRDPMATPDELMDEEIGYFPTISKNDRPLKGESAKDIIHTAICIQPRSGRLYVFLPPVEILEVYLDLVKNLEKTAASLKIPIIIEGYEPPYDVRMNILKITPDPGVIEVNVPPVTTWEEVIEQTTSLYEEAHLNRLGTEKFMLDGRHSGTGGGNHFVFGSSTPKDSPFLRRPDLLASMVSFWNNHPSLSYLFSGLFIGPTSQAPRVDEARQDSLYELEIALEQVRKAAAGKKGCPPWLVDRLFRNLLIDGAGNTHRTEICIDKLFSPDSATGRLGLVELRGFEMPPHYQMSLTQQLLLRSLIASFWKNPVKDNLIHWNTSLHDRFMLPHFVLEDMKEVLLHTLDSDFKIEYFLPHFEFRFPVIGKIAHEGIELELRTAIEPWYVLGEEPVGGGTSRSVDSSLERIQIRVTGLINDRYFITCNQRRLPLHPTGTVGEFIAGVRYRAWQPPSCLHPTISVHTPLIFDILDTYNKRSIGGCTYHVSHPGGRNYDTYPVNALEAEARRHSRFFKIGHTPGKFKTLPALKINPDFPLTLDLRRD